MKTADLIALLQQRPGSSTPYVQITDPETGLPMLVAVTGIAEANSAAYGTAVVIELEE